MQNSNFGIIIPFLKKLTDLAAILVQFSPKYCSPLSFSPLALSLSLSLSSSLRTMSQAVGVARAMNAKRLVLTHFSQSQSRFPMSLSKVPDHCVLAADGMQVIVCARCFRSMHHFKSTLRSFQISLDDVFFFRGEQSKCLANFILHSRSLDDLQYFSETPAFDRPPRLMKKSCWTLWFPFSNYTNMTHDIIVLVMLGKLVNCYANYFFQRHDRI